MESAEGASNKHDLLVESIKIDLGFINNPATIINQQASLRVPEHLKQLNPELYKPRLISVGPVHHGQPELQPMEAFKRRHAKNFIEMNSLDIEALIGITKNYEERLRNNYGIASSEIPSDEFVKIMCVDATFLVKFLSWKQTLGTYSRKWNNVNSDLFLLENQIPSYYLHEVLALSKNEREDPEFFLWDGFLYYSKPFWFGRDVDVPSCGEKHLLDRLRTRMVHKTNEIRNRTSLVFEPCPTISELHRAGIKFRPIFTNRLTFEHGILYIPPFVIDHNTARYFANLVASELFEAHSFHAGHYIQLLDYFIDGPEDVRLLVESGILKNYLEDDKAAASLVNEFSRSVDYWRPGFRYTQLVIDLNAHCDKAWVKWKPTHLFDWKRDLKTNYFGYPWKVLSVIAAVILLGLTVIQTVCSLLQL